MRTRLLLSLVAAVLPLAACSGGRRSSTEPPSSSPARSSSVSSPSVSTGTAAPSATRQVVRRPVTAAGRLTAGYTAKPGQGSIICSDGMRSPVAVSDDVLSCSPSAAYAIACWRAAVPNAAYCLTEPAGTVLTRYALSGGFGATKPTELEPQPIAVALSDGTTCTLRDSGAGARLAVHPDWVEYYYCGSDETRAVWGSADSVTAGIAMGDGPWQVQIAKADGSGALTTATVTTATFVGTAA